MGESEWLQKQQRSSQRTRWIIILFAILVLACLIGGISYVASRKSGSSANDGGSGGDSSDGTGNGTGPSATPGSAKYFTWDKKPVNLTITPNPALKKSLYGINYGPVNATYPWCTNTLGDVIEDVKLLSQLTNRIRLYGMDCNSANYTLMAIDLLGLNMTIVPTIWIDNNMTTYQRQYNDLFNNLKSHGFKHIEGISVGNEVLFRKDITATDLFSRIDDVRQKARAMSGAPQNLPVFTSDLGSNVNQTFVNHVDIAFANVHPYFAGIPVNQGTNWTFTFFQQNDLYYTNLQNKTSVISEVGWPSAGGSTGGAAATLPNEITFVGDFICAANSGGYKYYYFETFDTPWKTAQFGLLEGSWGLFNPDRTLKPGIVIPDCAPTAPSLF